MDNDSLQSRLSRISTVWTIVGEAHGDPGEADAARLALIKRYQGAAYRYLLAATRDPESADELFQEFALRMVRGAFHRADPGKGRFRDYVKSALVRLVIDHQNRQRRRMRPLEIDVAESAAEASPDADARFAASWREELMARAWAVLDKAQREGGQPYHSVLRFRAENPEASSTEMAVRLTEQLHPPCPFTETGIRKTLQRARAQFADALLDEVAHSLQDPSHDALEEELIDLDLLPYCRSALQRRRGLPG